ncbi:F5/8 type C domain protein [Bacillus subtilis]|nr:F5/8 type C domain protein [Bacillus subtilis]
MDIVSYSKAMQGRKNLDLLNKRLGVGDYKNGDKDVKGTFANVKARLDALEKKRQGLIDKEIFINTKEDFAKGTFIGLNADTGLLALNKTESSGESNVNLIPVMTSNTAPSGVVSASAESLSNGPAYRAFNGTTNSWEDRWFVEDFVSDTWLQYKYDSPVIVTSYEIHPVVGDNGLEETRAPRDFKFHGSNDGETWDMIGLEVAISGWKAGNPKRFFTQNRIAYQYYRLTVLANNGDKSLEIGELKMLGPSLEYTNQGEWISQEIDLGNDFLELSAIEVVGTGNIKVSTKTNHDSDFIELDGKNIKSRNGKRLTLKVQFKNGEVLPTIDSIKIKYKIRPLPNRVSDLETSIHINLNKHNLRVNSLLDKKRYNMKDMIIDDFGDSSGIDLINSKNVLHDQQNHKVIPKDKTQAAILITTVESVETIPTLFLLSSVTEDNAEDNLEYYVSRNNESWMRIEKDKLVSLDKLPEGKELLVKVVLKNGKELHAISYSWL